MIAMDDVDIALAALADPTRRRVVELLIEAPRRTNELAEAIGASVPAVSRQPSAVICVCSANRNWSTEWM